MINMENAHEAWTTGKGSIQSAARLPFAMLSAVLAASALLPLPGADGRIWHLPSICPFYQATGLPCPGCGLTRAFVCIAHGRFAESLHWHPLGLLIFATAILFWLDYGARVVTGGALFRIRPLARSRLAWSGAAVFLATGACRMAVLALTHTRF
jgi:hypothetical protein